MDMTEKGQWFIDVGNIGYHSYGCALGDKQKVYAEKMYEKGVNPEDAANWLFSDEFGYASLYEKD